ncbi:MAG: hypothetical protein JO287_17155 [Pseudonocardiales bacterium]|nr:hypothetical protein [Pseudonocardiales bacterium]
MQAYTDTVTSDNYPMTPRHGVALRSKTIPPPTLGPPHHEADDTPS